MPELIIKAGPRAGQRDFIPDSDLQRAMDSGLYHVPEGTKATVISPGGYRSTADPTELGNLAERGITPETPEQYGEARERGRIEEEHGGIIGGIGVAAETAVDTATLGGYGAARRALFPEYHKERVEARSAHPGVALGAELVTAVGTSLVTGGTGVAASLAKLSPLGKAAVAADKLTKGGKAIRGMALEGAVEGFGAANQAMMLSEDPLELERVIGTLGTGVVPGGVIGLGAGVFGKAAVKGIQKARALTRTPAPTLGAGKVISNASDEGFQAVEALRAHAVRDVDVIGVMQHGSAKKVMTAQRGAKGAYARMLDDAVGLAERPSSMLKPLRKEAQLLQEAIDNPEKLLANAAKFDASAAARLGKRKSNVLTGELANAYGDYARKPITRAQAKAGVELSQKAIDGFKDALENGQIAAKRAEHVGRLPEVLQSNQALQQHVVDLLEAGKAGKRGFIENAVTGAAFAAGSGAAAGVLPDEAAFLAPLAGAAVAGKMSNLIFGRMGKASAAAAQRTNDAVDLFLKAGRVAQKTAVPAATRVLAAASFGETPEDKTKEAPRNALYSAYQAREKEIFSQVTATPEGLRLKPAARERIYDNLAGVRALAPQMADAIESQTAKKVTFLAEKLPKRPDYATQRLGPDNWRPSDMAMREFARYVAAITDPQGVFERVADGTVTPEDAEAVREVYPEQFQDFQEQIIARLPELREQLSYEKRLALSIFTGVPVDPAMDPRVLGVLQGHFVEEPGAGNQAPKANPQFGSVSKEEPTPGQARMR